MKTPLLQKLTVVLDLDHTLIYSRHTKIKDVTDKSLRSYVVSRNSALNPDGVLVIERPGLLDFLQELSRFCEVMLFTASMGEYAIPILQAIDPDGIFFHKTFFREHTIRTMDSPFAKNLQLTERPLERVVIVDDDPDAFSMQPHNGICVPKFWGNANDNVLLSSVLPLIRKLSNLEDVRDYSPCTLECSI